MTKVGLVTTFRFVDFSDDEDDQAGVERCWSVLSSFLLFHLVKGIDHVFLYADADDGGNQFYIGQSTSLHETVALDEDECYPRYNTSMNLAKRSMDPFHCTRRLWLEGKIARIHQKYRTVYFVFLLLCCGLECPYQLL